MPAITRSIAMRHFPTKSALGLALGLALAASPASAIDLLQSYRLALSQDATYQAVRADTDARREAIPLARAQLLPNISASLQRSKNQTDQRSVNSQSRSTNEYEYFSSNYALTLRQPIYRKYNFALYQQAHSDVASAEATLDKSLQELVVRTASAYFEALMAKQQHALTLAQKEAYALQVEVAKLALAKGQGTVTDIDDAQSRYDITVAQELETSQNIGFTRRQLESIVNQPVNDLADLQPDRLELSPPLPANVEEWIARGEEINPELRALRASIESATQELEKARAGHFPTIDLIVQRSQSQSENNVSINSQYLTSMVGLQASVPLFAGGYTVSQMRQARSNIEKFQQQYEARRREVAQQIRKEFQSIAEGIAKIGAQQQAERSAQRALFSNQKGIAAGTRSRVDVLNAQQQLINVKRDLALARFQYILARVRLQGLVSSLNEQEIRTINAWLNSTSSG